MGLTHYEERDADYFFGRDRDREIISANLSARRLTLLYGESGVGKSSVLRAGVLHDLLARMRGDLEGGRRPRFVPAVFGDWRDDPGAGLLREVAGAVAAAVGDGPPSVPEDVPLDEGLDHLAKLAGGELLIVLDQFEEYFLYHHGDDRFAAEFPRAVNRLDLRAHFLISIREDQLAQLDRFKRRLPRLFESTLRIGHLDLESAREAVERPIAAYNSSLGDSEPRVEIEPALVSTVLEQLRARRVELDDRHDRAPVANDAFLRIEASYLQLVMTTIWDEELRRGSRILRASTLEELGGAGEIVRGHLDRVLGSLTPSEQETAGAALRFLVSGSGTKISHSLSDLAEFTGRDEEELRIVLRQLADPERRILRSSVGNPGPATERYELFHDVLASAVLDWRRRQAREQLERRAARERRKALLALGAAAAFLLLAASAVAVGVWALQQKRSAEHEREVARSRALLATATDQFGERLDRGILLSLEAYRTHPSAETRGGLIAAVERTDHLARILRIGRTAQQLTVADHGRLVVTVDGDGVEVLDLDRPGKPVVAIRGTADSAALGPGGTVLAVGSRNSVLRRDLKKSRSLPTLRLGRAAGRVVALAFSPDGRRILAVTAYGTVALWNATTGRRLAVPVGALGLVGAQSAVPGAIAVSSEQSSGRRGSRLSVLRFDDLGSLVVHSLAQRNVVWEIALSADGIDVASRTLVDPGRLTIWNSASGRRGTGVLSTDGLLKATPLALDRTHRTIAVGLANGSIQLWGGSLVPQDELTGHAGPVLNLAFSPDGRRLISSGDDGATLVWRPQRSALRRTLNVPNGSVGDASIAPDGRQVAAVSILGGGVRVWSIRGRTAKAVDVTIKPVRRATTLGYAPHGRTLAVGGDDGTVVLVEPGRSSGRVVAKPSRGGSVRTLAFGGSRTLAWATNSGKVVVRDFANNRVSTLRLGSRPRDLALSTDGKLLAAAAENGTSLWDVGTGKRLALPVRGEWVNGVAFDREANILASAIVDGGVVLWDVRHNRRMGAALGTGSDRADSVAFSADGRTLAAGTDHGITGLGHLYLWDVPSGQQLGLPLADRSSSGWPVDTLAFSPDGRMLVAGSDVLTLWSDLLWSNVAGMERRLCSVVGRNLSPDDWHAFLPWAPYRRTCPGLPAGS
jgi:WD40 repeat protein